MSSSLLFFSLDVLSSGTEMSGTGLYLSVWRQSTYKTAPEASNAAVDAMMETSQLLSRYSLSGCACDVTSRAAADQKFSLSSVQAIFCTTRRLSELANLPGLLYALQRSCNSGTLSIISLARADAVQTLVELLHGRQAYPTVHVCQIPSSDLKAKVDPTWWQVYTDAHIVVHVAVLLISADADPMSAIEVDETPTIVYLFTFQDNSCSLLYIPETTPDAALSSVIEFVSSVPTCLPTETAASPWKVCIRSSTTSNSMALPSDWIVFTTNATSMEDDRLLLRARLQTQELQGLGRSFSEIFPSRSAMGKEHRSGDLPVSTHTMLQTGTSAIFDRPSCTSATSLCNQSFRVYDRCRRPVEVQVKVIEQHATSLDDKCLVPSSALLLDRLQRFCSIAGHMAVEDENEIDLEEDEDDDDVDSIELSTPKARLLILGTGCASPSPLRGSSGYALVLAAEENQILPTTIVLEAGEGFCTQWNRHSSCPFRSIRVIWISHAHWDHYGGLVNLLYNILRDTSTISDAEGSKRRRVEPSPPFVVAPTKVLRYLELIWGDADRGKYYRGVHAKAPRRISDMCDELNRSKMDGKRRDKITLWDVVKVDHGCEAYGLVLGLQKPAASSGSLRPETFTFAFSGDTRPSTEFARRCRLACSLFNSSHIDFMVHEATFDENEAHMSVSKKHSTIQEALHVAKQTKTLRLVLTHLSQRYRRGCEVRATSADRSYPLQTLFAVDGMTIPLF